MGLDHLLPELLNLSIVVSPATHIWPSSLSSILTANLMGSVTGLLTRYSTPIEESSCCMAITPVESMTTDIPTAGPLNPTPEGHDEIETALSSNPIPCMVSWALKTPAEISYDWSVLPARTCSQPSDTEVPRTLLEASAFPVDHLESQVEVAISLLLIPAFSVEISSWFPIICRSVILLLARKLPLSHLSMLCMPTRDWLLLRL